MGHAAERMHLVESVEDVQRLVVRDPEHLACLTQTTLSVDDTREIMEALKRRFPAIRLPRKDDICYATQNRQNAVKQLTREADVLLVVGAPESSNSNRLVELGAKSGARAYLVQTAADIDPAWIAGARCVAVTAGASAPEVLVQDVIARLRAIAGADTVVDSLPRVDEGVVFQVPAELRAADGLRRRARRRRRRHRSRGTGRPRVRAGDSSRSRRGARRCAEPRRHPRHRPRDLAPRLAGDPVADPRQHGVADRHRDARAARILVARRGRLRHADLPALAGGAVRDRRGRRRADGTRDRRGRPGARARHARELPAASRSRSPRCSPAPCSPRRAPCSACSTRSPT